MKKILSGMLAAVLVLGMVFAFAGCGDKKEDTLICGVTIFKPMNFKDDAGNWTGFDTEFAQKVAEKLGMKAEFQIIEWDNKYLELEAGTINCIWNGFTGWDGVTGESATDGDKKRSDSVDFSYGYMLNQQCVVIKADRADEFTSVEDLDGMTVAAEKGSAGEEAATEVIGDDGKIIDSAAQIDTFLEVLAGDVDCAIVDILLAQELIGKGNYADLTIAADIQMGSEVYAIGFKKGSDLTARVNTAMKDLYDSGVLKTLAEKYGIEHCLVLDTTFKG
ncbi:MAG: transporter substrate-binding domain-containing protein [Oscillospiraceae bacterium]|nr:transporter substrate-binding domain-containing protein [Oscillospiraceae bacterium]